MQKWMWMTGLMLALLAGCSGEGNDQSATAQDPEASIRAAHSDWPIKQVHKSQIDGLYEVQIGDQIAYSDATGRYVIHGGHLLDTETKTDITRDRLQQLNRIDWSVLPLEKAIVSGDADATQKLAVFTDPDCPYCRKLEKMLKELHGVNVYTFLFPLEELHPHARAHAEAIWCSPDKHAMLERIMIDNADPAGADCATPIDDLAALGAKLSIHGTPALIAGDGRRMNGAPRDIEILKKWLAER